MQSREDLEVALEFGISASIAGDSRMQRSLNLPQEPYENPSINQFKGSSSLLILASTHREDEEIVVQKLLENLDPAWKVIIAPHEIDEHSLVRLRAEYPNAQFYSEFLKKEMPDLQILILDTIGDLKYLYRYAKAVYVGGGYGKGIHNILEPLAYGVDVAIGPNHLDFGEAKKLKELKAISVFSQSLNRGEIKVFLDRAKRSERLENQKSFWATTPDTAGLVVNWIEHNLDL